MLITQFSIISSYTSLWYIFTQTQQNDIPWVFMGVVCYQLVMFVIDWRQPSYIRPRMISILRGELIAWCSVGVKAFLDLLYHLQAHAMSVYLLEFEANASKICSVAAYVPVWT